MTNEEFQTLVLRQLQALTEGQVRVESEIKELKISQAKLEVSQFNLAANQLKLEDNQLRLENNQLKLEDNQLKLENNQLRLESNQLKLESKIENEVIDKIRALSDGFELRGNQIENLQKHLDKRLDIISGDINYLVRKTSSHEDAILELKQVK